MTKATQHACMHTRGGGTLIQYDFSLLKGESWTETSEETWRTACEDEGRDRSDAPTEQSLPGNHQKPEKRLEQALPPERTNLANTLVLDF